MTLGYAAVVLHAHLPYVRHPEQENCLEERWLFEAITECYMPILETLERLEAERIPFRLTLSLSPTLMAMLDDPLLRRRYQLHLEAGADLAERETRLLAGKPEETVAHYYRHWLRDLHHRYTRTYSRDLLGAFHRLAKAGYLELITCAATHGFLPFFQHHPEAVRAQILIAVHEFRRRFGHAPRGFWLPECGYFPGVDAFVREAGVEYCILETHALSHARPSAPRGTYAHGWTPGGVAAFGRDALSSNQVWSANEGYPGDSAYREFYRDIGWERDPGHLGRLAGPDGVRTFSGFKYHRVTGPTEHKDLYDRWAAEQTAVRHAAHFVHQRALQGAQVRGWLPSGPPPLMIAPYDAELFGHWWFEGPYFLGQVARNAATQNGVRFITPGDFLDWHREGQGVLEPAYSSWGYEGYGDFWCDGANHWMWRHLHGASRRMTRLACQDCTDDLQLRAAAQAARELLLAQASDWPFILKAGTTVEYARRRFESHIGRFHRLETALRHNLDLDPHWLAQVEAADSLFPDIDYRVFAPQ